MFYCIYPKPVSMLAHLVAALRPRGLPASYHAVGAARKQLAAAERQQRAGVAGPDVGEGREGRCKAEVLLPRAAVRLTNPIKSRISIYRTGQGRLRHKEIVSIRRPPGLRRVDLMQAQPTPQRLCQLVTLAARLLLLHLLLLRLLLAAAVAGAPAGTLLLLLRLLAGSGSCCRGRWRLQGGGDVNAAGLCLLCRQGAQHLRVQDKRVLCGLCVLACASVHACARCRRHCSLHRFDAHAKQSMER